MLKVHVELAHGLDADRWAAQHALGEVPNSLPFGLEALRPHGISLTFRPPAQGRIAGALSSRVNPRFGDLQWTQALGLEGAAARRRADLVLGWDEWTGVPAALRQALPGEPPVVSGVMNLTDWPDLSSGVRNTIRRALHRTRAVYVHSSLQAEILREEWGLPGDQVNVIPFGVDSAFFANTGDPVDRDLVVTVGDDEHRDYPNLVTAFGQVRDARPSSKLAIVTSRHDVPEAPGVSVEHVKLGPRRPRFYSGAAVVAVAAKPNIHGSGLSIVTETMACGRPWVVTDSPGFADHFADGDGGRIVPSGDPAALAEAISGLLSDPAAADELGRRGRQIVEERMNSTVQGAALAKVLLRAAEAR